MSNKEKIYEKCCRNCKFFYPAIPASQINPEEPADCSHPIGWIAQFNYCFPYANGCKNHEFKFRHLTESRLDALPD